jgi:putative ABC transport system permease protein
VFVLAGALAAGLGGRLYDAAVLKALGATRRQLVSAFAIEYALLGLIAALFRHRRRQRRGLGAGALSGRHPLVVFAHDGAGHRACRGDRRGDGGLLTTWRALNAKPAQLRTLRTE